MTFHLDGQQPAMAAMSLGGHYAGCGTEAYGQSNNQRGGAERDGGGVAQLVNKQFINYVSACVSCMLLDGAIARGGE